MMQKILAEHNIDACNFPHISGIMTKIDAITFLWTSDVDSLVQSRFSQAHYVATSNLCYSKRQRGIEVAQLYMQ